MFSLTAETLTAAARMITSTRLSVVAGSPRTDGQHIWLPGIKPGLDARALEILRGYFLHEAGHIVYGSFRWMPRGATPEGLPQAALHHCFNAIEDTRIESRLVQDYAGALSPITAINEDNLVRNNEGAPALGTFMSACHAMMWRVQGKWDRATYCEEGKQLLRDTPGAISLLDDWARRLVDEPGISGEAAASVAEEICRLISEAPPAEDRKDVGMPNYAPAEADGGDDSDGGDDTGNAAPADDGNDAPADDGNAAPADAPADAPAGDGDGKPGDQRGGMADEVMPDGNRPMFVPEVFDNSEQPSLESVYETADVTDVVNAATSIRHRAMNPHVKVGTNYARIHSDAMRILQRLRKTLAANDLVSWTQPRDSGHRIDRRRLAGVTAGVSTRAFNRRRIDEGTKSMVSIALDMSSSMSKIGMTAASVAYMVADACESSRVPCGIATFNTTTYVSKSPGQPVTPGSTFDSVPRGYTDMLPALVQHNIWAAQHPRLRPVLFVVSDGCTDRPSICARTVINMAQAGHRVYGIAIGDMDGTVRNAITDHGMGVVQLPETVTAEQLCQAFSAGLASI